MAALTQSAPLCGVSEPPSGPKIELADVKGECQLPKDESPPVFAWGWYEADQLPALLLWLDTGSAQEQALADALFEAMRHVLPHQLTDTNTEVSPLSPPPHPPIL